MGDKKVDLMTFSLWMISLWFVLTINGCQNRSDLSAIKTEIIKLQEIQKNEK